MAPIFRRRVRKLNRYEKEAIRRKNVHDLNKAQELADALARREKWRAEEMKAAKKAQQSGELASDEIGVRIRELRLEGKTFKEVCAIINPEFGISFKPDNAYITLRRYCDNNKNISYPYSGKKGKRKTAK